jgi:hypothetical protein
MMFLESKTQQNILESLEQTEPIAILRDGMVTGYYVPVMPDHKDTQAIRASAEKMQRWLEAQSISEDDILSDFNSLRKNQHMT